MSQLKEKPIYPPRSIARGEEMRRLRDAGKKVKAVGKGTEDSSPKRMHIREEFDAIFDNAIIFDPSIFNDTLHDKLADATFSQRPLKPVKRGPCAYMKGESRALKSDPVFQFFRLRKEMSDLRYADEFGEHPLPPRLIDEIEVEGREGKRLTWRKIEARLRNCLGKDCVLIYENLEKEGRKYLSPVGNEDDYGTANISGRAAGLLLERMRSGEMDESAAAQSLAAERDDFIDRRRAKEVESIEPTGKMLPLEVIEKIHGPIIDPTVRKVYRRLKKGVDYLTDRYGPFDRINIESAKPLGRGKKGASDQRAWEREQAKRADEYGQGKRPHFDKAVEIYGDLCFYCGATDNLECEHIVPRSFGPVGFFGCVPSCRRCNAEKNDRLPFEWLEENPDIKANVRRRLFVLSKQNKKQYKTIRWLFQPNVLDEMGRRLAPNSLPALRYIEKIVRTGLAGVADNVFVVKGLVTAKARKYLHLSKDRKDHRHHAQDACVVAAIRPERLGKARKHERKRFLVSKMMASVNDRDIRKAVAHARVTHQKSHSRQGRLHETKSRPGQRSVPIPRGHHAMKVATGGNWACEVYKMPDGEWVSITITRFDANRHDFVKGSTYRPHRNAKLIRRLFVNDVISTSIGQMRVKKMDVSGCIVLVPSHLALDKGMNVDARKLRKLIGDR